MFVYVGRTYTVTATGSTRREVRCEKCGQTYYYDMIRAGTGSGSSPYMINNKGAAGRAQVEAHKRVGTALKSGSDPVPCPECGWFQSTMIVDARRERYAWMRTLGYFVGGMGLLVCGLLYWNYSSEKGQRNEQTPVRLLAAAVGSITSGILLIGLRRILAARFDPNAGFPEKRPEPIPGMPPALKPLAAPHAGTAAILVADRQQPEVRRGWLTVQMPRIVWPPHCCNCMGEAHTRFRRAFGLSSHDSSLPLPICHRCAKVLSRRAWLWAFLAWPLSLASLAILILPIPVGDVFARIVAVMISTVVLGTLLMFGLPFRMARPSRLKVIDRRRAIYRVRFSNPQYAETIARFYDGAPVEADIAQPATGGFPVQPVAPIGPT